MTLKKRIYSQFFLFSFLFFFSSFQIWGTEGKKYPSLDQLFKIFHSKLLSLEKLKLKRNHHLYEFYKSCSYTIYGPMLDFLVDSEIDYTEKNLRDEKECAFQAQIMTLIFKSLDMRCQSASKRNSQNSDVCSENIKDRLFYTLSKKMAAKIIEDHEEFAVPYL